MSKAEWLRAALSMAERAGSRTASRTGREPRHGESSAADGGTVLAPLCAVDRRGRFGGRAGPGRACGPGGSPGEDRPLPVVRPIPRRANLATEDGRRLAVFSPGYWNEGAGPDFRNAEFAFGDEPRVRGDVEIHVAASDWNRHGHADDPMYDRVLLHVVLHNDLGEATVAQRGRRIPQLALASRLSSDLGEILGSLDPDGYPRVGCGREGACCRSLRACGRDAQWVGRFLDIAGDERMLRKAERFAGLIEKSTPDDVLYEALMEVMGYSANRRAFKLLARAVPLRTLRKLVPADGDFRDTLLAVQALLFGAAGFLDAAEPPADPESARYLKSLRAKWDAARPDFARVWPHARPHGLESAPDAPRESPDPPHRRNRGVPRRQPSYRPVPRDAPRHRGYPHRRRRGAPLRGNAPPLPRDVRRAAAVRLRARPRACRMAGILAPPHRLPARVAPAADRPDRPDAHDRADRQRGRPAPARAAARRRPCARRAAPAQRLLLAAPALGQLDHAIHEEPHFPGRPGRRRGRPLDAPPAGPDADFSTITARATAPPARRAASSRRSKRAGSGHDGAPRRQSQAGPRDPRDGTALGRRRGRQVGALPLLPDRPHRGRRRAQD